MRDCYRVKCGQLANGLRFYTKYDSDTTKETVIIAVIAGSIHNPPGKSGLAHLIEHELTALLDCDPKFQSFALRAFGSRYPALDFEILPTATVYGSKTPLKKRDNRQLLSFLAKVIIGSNLGNAINDSQKAAIHQECYQEELDYPEYRLARLFYETLFPRSPIDLSVFGRIQDIKKLTADEAREHRSKFYVPANIFVVFFGPKFDEVKDVLNNSSLGQWQLTDDLNKPWGLSLKKPRKYRQLRLTKQRTSSFPGIHQYRVMVGLPVPCYSSKDREGLLILGNVLEDRLYVRLRLDNREWDKGVYSVEIIQNHSQIHGIFGFITASLSRQWIDHSIAVFEEECHKLAVDLINREELLFRVAYLQKEFRQMLADGDGDLVDKVVEAVSNGDIELKQFHNQGGRLAKFLKRGGRQRLRGIAEKYLTGHKAIVILKPK